MRTKPKIMMLPRATIESMDKLYEIDPFLFVHTLNDFFIMGGLLPDIPIHVTRGMFQKNGIWQPGLKYVQYPRWEDNMEVVFGQIKPIPRMNVRIYPN